MYGSLLKMKCLVSKKEMLAFVFAMCVYAINKWGISHRADFPFLSNYLNDFIGGYVFATILTISYRFYLKREIRVRIYFLIIIMASIYWEYIAPLYLPYSVKDVNDIVAYLAGGWVFLIFIKKKCIVER